METKRLKTTDSVIVSLFPEVKTHNFNVTDIGTNKPYIDLGRTAHEFSSELKNNLTSLDTFITSQNHMSYSLVLPGFSLKLLENYDEDALTMLQSFVQKHNPDILTTTFYGSSPSVLSGSELVRQLDLQRTAIHECFGKTSGDVFFFESMDRKQISDLGVGTVIFPSENHPLLSFSDVASLPAMIQSNNVDVPFVRTTPFVAAKTHAPLQDHIKTELQGLYTHISKTQDEDLLTSWAYLANPALLHTVSGVSDISSSYDAYIQYMMMCNDIAHKVRSVRMGATGQFITTPDIFESPATALSLPFDKY